VIPGALPPEDEPEPELPPQLPPLELEPEPQPADVVATTGTDEVELHAAHVEAEVTTTGADEVEVQAAHVLVVVLEAAAGVGFPITTCQRISASSKRRTYRWEPHKQSPHS
jgi:hypothetical protein